MLTIQQSQTNHADEQFKGLEGTIDEVIQDGWKWRVYVQGSLWTARSNERFRLSPGDDIKVLGRDKQKLKLVIEPL